MELLCLLKNPMFNWQGEMDRLTNCCFWTGRSVLLQIRKDGQVDRYSFQLHASLFIKEILLEIGFIEEMKTTWGNKEQSRTS